jgi:hypothetical protein
LARREFLPYAGSKILFFKTGPIYTNSDFEKHCSCKRTIKMRTFHQNSGLEVGLALVEVLVGVLSGHEADEQRRALVRRRVVDDGQRTALAIRPGVNVMN